MQQSDMAEVINLHFDAINKLTRKAPVHFNKNVLYNLRVEIKKLRAFLHLVKTEPGSSDNLKVKKRLKTFYGYIGIIRTIQLQEHLMAELLTQDMPAIEEYIHQLKSEAEGWKKEVIKLLRDQTDFNEERDAILASLPEKLSKLSVRRFVRQKAEEIEGFLILRQAEENNLHALRNVLKDVVYNWPYVKAAADLLPLEMSSFEKLHALATLLGNYGDQCTALDYLQPGNINLVTDRKGQDLLRLVREAVEKRRDGLRREFFVCLLNFREQVADV